MPFARSARPTTNTDRHKPAKTSCTQQPQRNLPCRNNNLHSIASHLAARPTLMHAFSACTRCTLHRVSSCRSPTNSYIVQYPSSPTWNRIIVSTAMGCETKCDITKNSTVLVTVRKAIDSCSNTRRRST